VNSLLINLSFLIAKPTGVTTYAINLLPHLQSLNPKLLISPFATRIFSVTSQYDRYAIPPNLTPEQGIKGHLQRLLWTQLQLSQISKYLEAKLLFSPVTEAPLYTNCRSVVTVHDLIPLRFPKLSPLTPYHRYYIPQVLKQAEHIICNSTATAQDIVDFFQISAEKITPIPLAYDASHFRRLNFPQQSEERPYFIYIGRHNSYKNLHRLIAAFAAMPSCRNCDLLLAGTGDRRYTPQLKAQSIELGIADRVKFLDYVPYEQLPILLNRAIALVFPSLWEGFGLPVLEAMACGTPVITSNLSSLPEVTGDAALLVNPYSIEEIAAAMESIVTDSKLRSRLADLSLTRASQFSWEKTGLATVEVLKRFL
jgi:glycosyltransferase involved in cell wall biosynthesis